MLPKVLLGLGLILLIQQIGAARKPGPPPLAANCTTATFALSTHSVKQGRLVTYAIVGPDARRYVLGVDTASFVRRADGGWDAVPRNGADDSYEVAAGVKPMHGCKRTGYFGVPIPVGTHVVTLYELTDTGAVEIERQDLTVTEQDE